MKYASLVLFSLCASTADLMSGSVSSNGVHINFATRLEPGTPPISKHGGGTLTEQNIIKRHICNFENDTYFGYDLVIDPRDGGVYQLRFSPLSITPKKMAEIFDKVPNWTPLPLPGGPVTMEARAGDTVALELFVNPGTGQKVTDYLTINGGGWTGVKVSGPARYFGAENAGIELSAAQVTVDGRVVHSERGAISGEAVWVDLPEHGRFVFSPAPRPDLGMRKAGEIRGTTMTWRMGETATPSIRTSRSPPDRAFTTSTSFTSPEPSRSSLCSPVPSRTTPSAAVNSARAKRIPPNYVPYIRMLRMPLHRRGLAHGDRREWLR